MRTTSRALGPLAIGACLCAGVALGPRDAHADVSSWFFAGGGYGSVGQHGATDQHPEMRLQLGLGSPPSGPVAVGGLFQTLTWFGAGTDLALTARAATGGFVRGGFGFALDAGGYRRFWGAGSTGFLGSVVVGGPWGLQATVDYASGSDAAHAYGAVIGIDFLRLTVYRTTGEDWFPNPFPATGRPAGGG